MHSPNTQFADAHFQFSVFVPPFWHAETSGQQGTRVFFLFKSTDTAGFRANVNVMVHQLGAMTPEEYLTFSRLQVKQMTGQPKMDIDQPAAHPEGARLFEWHAQMGPMHLKMRQLIAFRPPLAFVVTATAPYNEFAQYRADFEAILDSLRLDTPVEPVM